MTIGATEVVLPIEPEVQIHAALFSQRGFLLRSLRCYEKMKILFPSA